MRRMPYRTPGDQLPCSICDVLTPDTCRRCGAPLCPDHAARFDFYVSTIECQDSSACRPFTAAEVDTTRKPLTVKFAGVNVPLKGGGGGRGFNF